MSTMQRVREAIEASHQAIEQTDFSKSLMDGRITRPAYCVYLGQIWQIHHKLEQTLPGNAATGRYFDQEMVRTPEIERDLTALGSVKELHSSLPITQRITEQMQAWHHDAPFALLGCGYILEGSRMGSLLIGRALIKSLQLPESSSPDGCVPGVEYHLHNAAQTPRRVRQLKAAIDASQLTEREEQQLTIGSCTFMNLLTELYRQLPVGLAGASSSVGRCPVHHMQLQAHLKSA